MNDSSPQLVWGSHHLTPGEWHQLDELWFCAHVFASESQFSYAWGCVQNNGWVEFGQPTELRVPLPSALRVSQRLSTRPVVARPYTPVTLPSGQSIRLFVGTTLWFTVHGGDDVLIDVPVRQLSDTWFGADTITGEVCYFCDTKARLSMDRIDANPFKAITPVDIENRTDSVVKIDRINLPIPNLALYRDKTRHWTSALSIRLDSPVLAGHTQVRIEEEPPAECVDGEKLADARTPVARGMLDKTMELLLG